MFPLEELPEEDDGGAGAPPFCAQMGQAIANASNPAMKKRAVVRFIHRLAEELERTGSGRLWTRIINTSYAFPQRQDRGYGRRPGSGLL